MTSTTTTEYAVLAQRLIDGDTSVTSAQLEKARVADQLAELREQAWQREESERLAVQAEADRVEREQAFADDLAALDSLLGTAQAAYLAVTDAIRTLNVAAGTFDSNRRRLGAQAQAEGRDMPLPNLTPIDYVEAAVVDVRDGLNAHTAPHPLHDDAARRTIAECVEAATPPSYRPGGAIFDALAAKRAARELQRADRSA